MTQPQPSFEELRAIYEELRRTARRMLNREPYAHTLESMELVHQAWARLLSGDMRALTEQEPRQVLALAVLNMRRELVDHARRRRATKRPDPTARVDLADVSLLSETDPHTFLEIDRLIDSLERGAAHVRAPERKAQVARYALFAGLTEAEIAELLTIPKATVGADVRFVRAWLAAQLEAQPALDDRR